MQLILLKRLKNLIPDGDFNVIYEYRTLLLCESKMSHRFRDRTLFMEVRKQEGE